MVELCFVLDLRSLPPPFLRDLKQSLLRLANLYSISPSPSWPKLVPLRDRIGLCVVFENPITSSEQLKIVYTPSPSGNFCLQDFHDAVNRLPDNAFRFQMENSDVKFSTVDEVLHHWGGTDIMRKVIVITSYLPRDVDFIKQKSFTAATDKCVSVEFVLFKHTSAHPSNVKENIKNFATCISELHNCSFQTHLPDPRVLHGLVNRWLQDLKDEIEEPLQAHFNFKKNLVGSVNHIACNLYISVNQVVDCFCPSQICRCHGISLGDAVEVKMEESCCPVTGLNIGRSDVIVDSVKVGEIEILLPSVQSPVKLKHVSSPIDFCVIERIDLGSLSEGVVMGASYVVTPSTFQEIETAPDEIAQSDLNSELYRGICSALNSMDQGLVFSSNCNIKTMREATEPYYYVLRPSDDGQMLLKRLAGSEEVLHILSVRKGIEELIKDTLSQIDVGDYDLMLHEKGSRQISNMLVKESLQFGLLSPNMEVETYALNATQPKFTEVRGQSDSTIDLESIREETSKLVDLTTKEDKPSACSTEEWEQLVVNNVCSPICTSKRKLDQAVLSPPDGTSQLDAKYARLIERFEMPRQFGREPISPNLTSKGMTNSSVQVSYILMIMIPIGIAILAWKYFITLDAPVVTTSPVGPHSDCLESPVNIVSFAARHSPTATPSPTPSPTPSSMCVQCCPAASTLGALSTAMAWCIFSSIVAWGIFCVVLMVWTTRCWMEKDFEYWIEFIDDGWKTELEKMMERQTEKRRKLVRTATVCFKVLKLGSLLFLWGLVALYVLWPMFQLFHLVGKWESFPPF